MTTEERLSSIEQAVDILLDLNRRMVDAIQLNQQRIEQNERQIEQNRLQHERQFQQTQLKNERQFQQTQLKIEQNQLKIEQNERQIQQTQRLWIAVAKHYGLLDDIDLDPNAPDPNPN